MESHWELFEHASDMGIRGVGSTQSEAFQNVGLALTCMITDLEKVKQNETVKIVCNAPDLDLLLLDFINGIIYEMSTRKMLFSHFDVNIMDKKLEAIMLGEKIEKERHSPAVEAKAATFKELKVEQLPNNFWLAQCVVDI